MSTTVGAGIPLGGYQSPSARTAGLPDSGSVTNPLCRRAERTPPFCAPSSTMNAYACVSYGSFMLRVRQADHLVVPVAVEIGDRRRRGGPLQPHRRPDVRPRAGVPVVVVVLDRRAQPADELPPAEAAADEAALPVRVPGRGEDRRAVVVEDVDLVVVVRDDDLELRIVVEVADADVLAVGAVAVVAGAVEVGVVALRRQRVEPRPRRRRRAARPVQLAGRVEHEHLRAGRRGVRRRHDDLDAAVSVEVCGCHPARLRALAAAARRRRPAGLESQLAADEVVRGDGSFVSADHDLRHLVAVEVGDDARRVDPPLRRRALAELRPFASKTNVE